MQVRTKNRSVLAKTVVVSAPGGRRSTAKPVVLLCPGQGAQYVGMGKEWAEAHRTAQETFAEADDVLGMRLSQLCFEGPADQLNRTDIAQPALYVTAIAALRALQAEGEIDKITSAAGLSLGEFTALHIGGAFDFATGLQLVRLRGEAMQDAAVAREGGMVAILANDEERVQQLCLKVLDEVAHQERILVPANFNCPNQVVLSGSRQACTMALQVAKELDLTAKALVVAGAFHSPLMAPAARRLAKALEAGEWSPLRCEVLSNVTGRPHDRANVESIKGLLVEQLTRPVLWEASVRWLTRTTTSDDEIQFSELPPGRVLGGLMRKIDRKTRVKSLDKPLSDTRSGIRGIRGSGVDARGQEPARRIASNQASKSDAKP